LPCQFPEFCSMMSMFFQVSRGVPIIKGIDFDIEMSIIIQKVKRSSFYL